jgi:hypothetical protein
MKGRGITTAGYAQLSGKAVGPADLVQTRVAVEQSAIRAAAVGEGN